MALNFNSIVQAIRDGVLKLPDLILLDLLPHILDSTQEIIPNLNK